MKKFYSILALGVCLGGGFAIAKSPDLKCENYQGNWAGAPKTSCETVTHHWNYANVIVNGKTVTAYR